MIVLIIVIGDFMELFVVIYRTIFFYLFILVIFRIMGKREVGQLSIQDLVVSILIAELVAISIEEIEESLWLTVIPIIILVVFELIAAFMSLKFNKFRNIMEGKPALIINQGKINFKEMVRQRYNIDDLLTQLREQHIKSIEEVDYAILETSGKLSVFKKKDNRFGDYPLPLILDGKIQEDTLRQIQKTEKWLQRTLTEEKVNIEDIFYAFYQEKNIFIIKKEDLEK